MNKWLLTCIAGTLAIGCTASSDGTGVPSDQLQMLQALTEGSSLSEACAEIGDMCENDGEGCECFEYFCEDLVENSICEKLESACLEDCDPENEECTTICTMHSDSCSCGSDDGSFRTKRHRRHHSSDSDRSGGTCGGSDSSDDMNDDADDDAYDQPVEPEYPEDSSAAY